MLNEQGTSLQALARGTIPPYDQLGLREKIRPLELGFTHHLEDPETPYRDCGQ